VRLDENNNNLKISHFKKMQIDREIGMRVVMVALGSNTVHTFWCSTIRF
jgi:hypothetical protein